MSILKKAARSKPSEQSLKRKTWQFFMVVLAIFFVIFIVTYVIFMVRAAVENEVSSSELAMTGLNKNIEAILDRYNDMSRQIMINSDVIKFLRGSEKQNSYISTNAKYGIFSVTTIYSFVDSVYVYRLDGDYVRTGAGIMLINNKLRQSPEWNAPILEAKGGNIVMINGGGAFHKQIGTPLISMVRYIYDIDTQERIGLLVINLTASVLNSAMKDQGSHGRALCFFDQEGNVLWGDETLKNSYRQEFVGNGFHWEETSIGGQKTILCAYSTNDIPIVQVSSSQVLVTGLKSPEAVWIAVILMLAAIITVFSSGVFISGNIARPIDQLTDAIEDTKSEGMLQEIKLSLPNNEIRRLADSYNSMIVHINQLISQLIDKEKSVQKAEMRVLQEQIKPHFLYNSLETISYMALQSNAPTVHDALETLGSFYRNFLSKGSRDIPLRNEILIVKDYLALQKLRYGDSFDDEYNLDENALDTMIPKLMLQPLVENSLYHGVRLKGEKGIIRISAFKKDDGVHILVYDTGVGMTKDQISDVLLSDLKDDHALKSFGLKGTIERIRYYCNYRETILICSEPGEYTEIEIIIPNQR
jgi:two-component system sensor histidine kinase YesM